jgi:hypothetical protein
LGGSGRRNFVGCGQIIQSRLNGRRRLAEFDDVGVSADASTKTAKSTETAMELLAIFQRFHQDQWHRLMTTIDFPKVCGPIEAKHGCLRWYFLRSKCQRR